MSTPPAEHQRGRGLPTSVLIIVAVALLVVGGVSGALIGHSLGGDSTASARPFHAGPAARGFGPRGPGNGNGQRPGQGQGQGPGQGQPGIRGAVAAGTVSAVDGNTVTVKMQNGQEVKVTLDSGTTYAVATSGSKDDVKVGQSVVVTGSSANGVWTARRVQIGDAFRNLG